MKFDNMSPDQLAAMNEDVRALQRAVWRHAVPVRIAILEDDVEVDSNSGSGALLQLGPETYLLTADHNYAHYLAKRSEGHDAAFLIFDEPLDPPEVRYRDEQNDIIFLKVPAASLDSMVRANVGTAPHFPPEWPPAPVLEGDLVIMCGYPAVGKTQDETSIIFQDYSLMQPVSAVFEHHFKLQINRENMVDVGRAPFPEGAVDWGGISGAPVFALAQTERKYNLAGMVYEGGQFIPIILVAHLHHLLQPLPETSE